MMQNKIKYLALLILIMSFSLNGIAQDQSITILKQILDNNQELKLARSQVDRMLIEAKIGLTPNNPEIEYGYLWANEAENGNRIDFSIKQSFDFPSVYVNRYKLSKLKGSHAQLYYRSIQQELVLKTMIVLIDLTYKNKQLSVLKERLENVEKVEQMTNKMFKEGEVGRIETDKASLQSINLLSEYDLCLSDIEVLTTDLKVLNGSLDLKVDVQLYPVYLNVNNLDGLQKSFVYDDLTIVRLQSEIEMSNQEIKLSKSELFPEISFSYVSESIRDAQLKGFKGGISIPLWQKRNTVKHSKIALNMKEAEKGYEIQRKEADWEKHYSLYKSRSERLNSMSKILKRVAPYRSLLMAFELGEISLLNYITESSFYYKSEDNLLRLEKEMYKALAELLKVDIVRQLN